MPTTPPQEPDPMASPAANFLRTAPIFSAIYGRGRKTGQVYYRAGQAVAERTGIQPTIPQVSEAPNDPIEETRFLGVPLYPFYEKMHSAGELWSEKAEGRYAGYTRNIGTLPGLQQIRESALAFISVPRLGAEIIGMAPAGAVRLAKETRRNPASFLGYTAAGLVMQGKDISTGLTTKPVGTISQLAGMYVLFEGLSGAGKYGVGRVRTLGKAYVPIENIGYGPEYGYPKNIAQTPRTLRQSFRQGTLIPKPSEMSVGETVPYVPKMARLPGQATPSNIMYTAWEGTHKPLMSKTMYVGAGTDYVSGMFGAPIAETYFTKVAGQMPEGMGFDIGFLKRPSIMQTETLGFRAVPKGARAKGAVQTWVNRNLPPGKAAMPMMKPEYEAVIPTGAELEITGAKYYTKIGGINILGKKIFRTRVPIIEQRTTGGFKAPTPSAIKKLTTPTVSGSEMRPSPYANAPSLLSSAALIRGMPSLKSSSRSMVSQSYSGLGSSGRSLSRISSSVSSSLKGSSLSVSKLLSSPKSGKSSGFSGASYRPAYRSTPYRSPPYTPPYNPPYTPPHPPSIPPIIPPTRKSIPWFPEKDKKLFKRIASAKDLGWKITNPVPTLKSFTFNNLGTGRKRKK